MCELFCVMCTNYFLCMPEQVWAGFGLCKAKIVSSGMYESSLYPGEERRAFTVRYAIDGTTEDLEEAQLRPLLVVKDLPERKKIIDELVPAFDYLESRLTGTCETSQYSCEHMYKVCCAIALVTCHALCCYMHSLT